MTAANDLTVLLPLPGLPTPVPLNPDAWKRAAEITPMGRLAEPEDIAHLGGLTSPARLHFTLLVTKLICVWDY